MQVIIDIPEDVLKRTVFYREFKDLNDCITTIKALEKATPVTPTIDTPTVDNEDFPEGFFEKPRRHATEEKETCIPVIACPYLAPCMWKCPMCARECPNKQKWEITC